MGLSCLTSGITSLGDSINWEWIVHCAINSEDYHNVLIVSRDSDFGVTYDGKATLNDWLYREFKERVSRKRKVELTQKLTDAEIFIVSNSKSSGPSLIRRSSSSTSPAVTCSLRRLSAGAGRCC